MGLFKCIYFANPVAWISRGVILRVVGYSFITEECAPVVGALPQALGGDVDQAMLEFGEANICTSYDLRSNSTINVGLLLVDSFIALEHSCLFTISLVVAAFYFGCRALSVIAVQTRQKASFALRQVEDRGKPAYSFSGIVAVPKAVIKNFSRSFN